MPLVLDASVALAACFCDERTSYVDRLFNDLATREVAHAPGIWPFEVINALLTAERAQRMTQASVIRAIHLLDALSVEIESVTSLADCRSCLELARDLKLSAYDASYLELAQRRGFALATLDVRLKATARQLGVPIYAPRS